MAQQIVIQPGQRFGKLTTIKEAERRNGRVMWQCRCDCGNLKDIDKFALHSGLTKSCGCKLLEAGRRRVIDITGKTFGRLTVISPTGDSNAGGKALWNCLCDCGKPIIVTGKALRKGTTNSCGCLRADTMRDYATTHGKS